MSRDYRDVIAGGLLTAIGALAALVAWTSYPVGGFSHMGAGMFPLLVGALLAGVGLVILTPALFRVGPPLPKPDYWPLFIVLLALVVFALAINWFGLIPAIVLLTFTSALADNKLGVVGTIVLAVALAAVAMLIFRGALGLPLDPFKWPFS